MGLNTQQDPIGIAGGLNLYGYAGGDPINFSDPFGLCPPEDDDDGPECWAIGLGLTGNFVIGEGGGLSGGLLWDLSEGPMGLGVYGATELAGGLEAQAGLQLSIASSRGQVEGNNQGFGCAGALFVTVCHQRGDQGWSWTLEVGLDLPLMPQTSGTFGVENARAYTLSDAAQSPLSCRYEDRGWKEGTLVCR